MYQACVFLLLIFTTLISCTKSESPKSSLEEVKKAVGDLNQVVFETELVLPSKYKNKVKRTDLIIWDLKDDKGDFIAGGLKPVSIFPMNIKVYGRELKKDVGKNANLIFSARIVAYGDEGKPPKKNQLYSMVGSSSEESEKTVVAPKGVKTEALEKAMNKISHIQFKKITIGSRVHAEFGLGVF